MTGPEFYDHWHAHYGDCPPLGHVLRQRFPDRWMRIHSLPESQRYPASKGDWRILLERQNQLCSDLLGVGQEMMLVGGDFIDMADDGHVFPGTFAGHPMLVGLDWTLAWRVSLHRVAPEHYEPGIRLDVAFSAQVWQSGRWDKVLRAIGKDEMRLLLVAVTGQIVVAPYDGGVDVILPDTASRDACRQRYQSLLSARADGL